MTAITNILIPIDLRVENKALLDYGRLLAERFNAKLHLVTVIPGVEQFAGSEVEIPWFDIHEEELLAGARKGMEEFVARELGGMAATTAVASGDVVDEILEYADNNGCDLIIVGTHGRKGASRIFFGSVAEGVVRNARCPVLTLHPFE